MPTPVPDDLLPDELKPVAPKAPAKAPKAVPLDMLPAELKTTVESPVIATRPGILTAPEPFVSSALAKSTTGPLASLAPPATPKRVFGQRGLQYKPLAELTTEEGPTLRQGTPIEQEGIIKKAARFVLPKTIEEPLLGPEPYNKEKTERELAEWKPYGGEMKWPTIPGLLSRAEGAQKEAARMLLGEGRIAREIEERGPIKTVLPAAIALGAPTGLVPDFLVPDAIGGLVDLRKPIIENIDPFAPRPADSKRAALWDKLQSDPEELKKAKRRWSGIRARRQAEGMPLSDEGLPLVSWEDIKRRQRPIYEQVGKEREELQPSSYLAGTWQVPMNFAADLTSSLVGMIEAASEAVGPAIAPETPAVAEARSQLKQAKQSGDAKLISEAEDALDTAQQEAIGEKVGGGLAGMPGQTAGLAVGLADPSLKNSLLTKPFSTYVTFIEPMRAGAKWSRAEIARRPALEAKFNNFKGTIYKGAVSVAKAVLPEWLGKARDKFAQFVGDSVVIGDKPLSEIMDNIFHGKKGSVDRLREQLQRRVERGEVELQDLDSDTLQKVDVYMRPEARVGEVEAATRKAEAARAKAEKFATAKKMTTATAEQLAELTKEQDALKRAAENVEKQIVQAAGSADEARLQTKLKELQVEQDRLARREETLRKQSVQRGKAKVAAEAAVETAVPFVERMAEEAPGVKREGRKVSREFMSRMAEMERKESLADEALRRGLTADDVMRQREDAIVDRLGERAYEKAGAAAIAGIGLAERAKTMQPVATALQEARRAAAAQAPAVAGAERAAKAAEARVAEVAARPEVYMGETYIPKEALPEAKYSVEEVRAKNNELIQKAKDNPNEENFRASRAAVQELQILEDAQQRDAARVSDYRTELDRARQVAADTQEQVRLSNEQLADMQRRAQSPRTTVTAEELADAEARNQQARFAAQDALNNVDKAERAYNLIRDVDLPNKVPELTKETPVPVGGKLAEAFTKMPEKYQQIIEGLAEEASDLKKSAAEAGANLDVPVSDAVAAQIGVPKGSSLYTAARRFAEHLTNLDADVVPYMREFLTEQGVTRGAQEAASWLAKEVEAQQALAGLLEPQFGYVRRPVATVEYGEIKPTGEIDWRPEAARAEYAEAIKGGEQATGAKREMQKALREMQEMTTQPEKPKSIKTNNAEFDKLVDEYAQKVVEIGYGLKTPEFGGEPGEFLNAKDLADRKILTAERIKQRVLEPLLEDTMQSALHSEEFQRHLWKEVRKRLEAQGMKGAALNEAVAQVQKFVMKPDRLSFHSKNRFPTLRYNGVDILTRDDFIKAADAIAPRIMNKARANAFNYIAGQQSAAAQTFGLLHSIDSELNRFRKDASGEWLTNSQTGNKPINAATYATQVAEGVVNKNQPQPLIMPYAGAEVAKALDKVAEEPRWSPEQRAKIQQLSKDLRGAESAQGLQEVVNGIYSRVFEGTDASPPDFHNLHMNPSALSALKAHFASMADVLDLGEIAESIERVAQFTKKGVVPLNVRALVNNNLSNSLLQVLTRGAGFLPKLFTESYKFNKYLNGEHAGMSPQDLRMYENLANRQSLFRTEFRNLYGENPTWRYLKNKLGGVRRLEAAMNSGRVDWTAPFRKYKEFRDFLVDKYTKAGDAPFRLEEMVHVYKDFYGKLKMMEEGSSAEIPVSKFGEVRLTRDANGNFVLTDLAGREKPKVISLESPEMAKILSAAADVMQEQKFLNPQRLGLWFKALQSGRMSPLSGIFTWGAGALDIPFIKKGLVSKMMEGPTSFKTNSPAVLMEQAKQYTSWQFKRALMINASQAAFMDQRQAEDARRSVAFNPSLMSVILGPGGDPDYHRLRDVAPLLFTAPTTTAINVLSGAANWMRFSPLLHDSNFFAKLVNRDLDWAAMSQQQMDQIKRDNPEMAEFGEEMRKLAREDPQAYKNRALLKRDFIRWSKKEISEPSQALQMIGLAGSPFTRWIVDAVDERKSPDFLRRQLGSMVFGATPYSMFDVGMALGGQAGVKPMEHFSSYGTTMGKGGEREDASSLRDWAISQLFGIGWKRVFYGANGVDADDPRGYPATKAYLDNVHKKINDSVVSSLKRRVRKPLPTNATDEQVAEAADELKAYEWFKEGLDRVYEELTDALQEQSKKINKPK